VYGSRLDLLMAATAWLVNPPGATRIPIRASGEWFASFPSKLRISAAPTGACQFLHSTKSSGEPRSCPERPTDVVLDDQIDLLVTGAVAALNDLELT